MNGHGATGAAHATEYRHRGGHGHHAGHAEMFRRRFWVSLVLSVPVILWSEMPQEWLGFTMPAFPGSGALPPLLGTVVFLYGGWVFLDGAVDEIRARRPGMMLLVGLAIAVAFGASAATEFGLLDLEFWWELAALVTVMLLGHWQEMRALGQARGALEALAELLPDEAERVVDGAIESVAIADLRVGDIVLVRPGGRVPADGTVVDGVAAVDESMVTGESTPVTREKGDEVVAGTVVTDSSLRIEVSALGEDTALAGIQRMVAEAQESRSRTQALADRAAASLFYVAIGAGLVTAAAWLLAGDAGDAVARTVTVLVISCPHALGLAIPLVIALSTAISARHGLLVKDRLALERMRLVDVVLFDKTGTLTLGRHAVTGVTAVDGDSDQVLAIAAGAERESEHPLARAIVAAASDRGPVPGAEGFRSIPGHGVEARVLGRDVAVGGPAMLRRLGLSAPPALADHTREWESRGAAVLHVVVDGGVAGALALEDQIRPESRQVVGRLHELGIHVAMITGDAQAVAEAVGAELGVDEVFAEVLPKDKDSKVVELQARGHTVAMVGDGVNDAPALARADVGIAIGAGTDVAMESAGLVLASDDPRGVLGAIALSRAGYRKMLQNLGYAVGYNVLAIPLAAGVLAPWGFVLPPAVGAALMSVSTIVVALNAQLLRRLDLRPEPLTVEDRPAFAA